MPAEASAESVELLPGLAEYVAERVGEFDQIGPERRGELAELAGYVQSRLEAGGPARVNFICTHNSRRSHMAQLWTQVAAAHYGVGGVETFSGGTEGTAFNPNAVAALRRAGFRIGDPGDEANPRYSVAFAEGAPAAVCFSKVFNEAPNPNEGYCAVMVCSHADQNCPVVLGMDLRLAIRYEDPKQADGSPEEAATYDERCRQIAREMLYAFSMVA